MWLMQNAVEDPDQAGAGATHYMHLLGLVAMGYMWARMALKSSAMLAAGEGNGNFHENKLLTAGYFMGHMLPDTAMHLKRIEAGAAAMMALKAEAF